MRCVYSRKLALGLPIAFIFLLIAACANVSLKEYAWASYKSKSAELQRWNKANDMHLARGNTLVSNSSPTYFSNANSLSYSTEAKSNNQPVVQAWRELSKGKHLVPVYRYVIKPITGITAEEFISLGPYIQMRRGYPAKMPTNATGGAVITDWHISFSDDAIENLTPERVARVKRDNEYEKKRYYSISELEIVNSTKEKPIFGEQAAQKQALIDTKVNSLSGDIAVAREYDAKYDQFIKTEYLPYTYSFWADMQGCPSRFLEANWSMYDRVGNAESVIAENSEYIDCHSAALQSYDSKTYIEKFPSISAQARTLWANSSKTHKVSSIRTPKSMLQSPTYALESAANHLQQAIENIELAGRLAARNAQLDAYSKQNWANTLNSINQRNEQILRQTKPVVYPKTRPNNQASKKYTERSKQHTAQNENSKSPDKASITTPAVTELDNQNSGGKENMRGEAGASSFSTKEKGRNADNNVAVTNTNNEGDRFVDFRKLNQPQSQPVDKQHSQSSASQSSPSNANVKPGQAVTKPDVEQEVNRYVGAGRDYPFTGRSGQYYNLELAVDLAITALENDASEFCNGSYYAEILWSSEPTCKPHSVDKTYLCSISANVNCFVNRCDTRFCGTSD